MQVCRASGCGDCGVHFKANVVGKEAERHSPTPAPAENAWDNYVGQLLLLRYTRHTAIADPCAGA